MEINDFVVNHVYSNEDLEQAFRHSRISGMRYSSKTHTLVLISKNLKSNLYKDKWINNVLHYTGMGQTGDQKFKNQNKRLAESNNDPKLKIFLFEVFKEKEMTFAGQVKYVEPAYIDEEFDSENYWRKVIKFPIQLLDPTYAPPIENIIEEEFKIDKQIKKRSKTVKNFSQSELLTKALSYSKENAQNTILRKVSTQVYDRNPYIREYVKSLAHGICQLCQQPAPFEVDGEPFLHVHHIEYLANGGHDTIENSIAICPNCHYRIHKLELNEDKEKLTKIVENRLG